MHGGGGVGKNGQGGGFSPGQFGGGPAEVPPGRRFQPHYIPPERCMGGIEREDFPFAAAKLQPGGLYGFYHLLPQGALLAARKPDYLHRECASAAHYAAGSDIVHGGPHQGHGVHSRMPAEPSVLKLHQGPGETFGNGVGRGKAPLTVFGDARAQEFPFRTLHYGGIDGPLEQVPGQAEKPAQQQEGCQAGEDSSLTLRMTVGNHRETTAVPAPVEALMAGSYMASHTMAGIT